jgi:O-antigen/teichoic acid export membrane protein
MLELFFTLISLTIFVGFLIFALWFGAALIVVMLVSGVFLALFVVVRGYYLNWRYGKSNFSPTTTAQHTQTQTTIIDVEYKDVSDK